MFAGSDARARRWAIANTLIQSCKLNDVEPLAWLSDACNASSPGKPRTTSYTQ